MVNASLVGCPGHVPRGGDPGEVTHVAGEREVWVLLLKPLPGE